LEEDSEETHKEEIKRLGLEWQLVTSATSFVAQMDLHDASTAEMKHVNVNDALADEMAIDYLPALAAHGAPTFKAVYDQVDESEKIERRRDQTLALQGNAVHFRRSEQKQQPRAALFDRSDASSDEDDDEDFDEYTKEAGGMNQAYNGECDELIVPAAQAAPPPPPPAPASAAADLMDLMTFDAEEVGETLDSAHTSKRLKRKSIPKDKDMKKESHSVDIFNSWGSSFAPSTTSSSSLSSYTSLEAQENAMQPMQQLQQQQRSTSFGMFSGGARGEGCAGPVASRKSLAPAAAAPLVKPNTQARPLDRIISLSHANGLFDLDDQLAEVIGSSNFHAHYPYEVLNLLHLVGKALSSLVDSIPAALLSLADETLRMKIWSTVLAMALLQKTFDANKDEWELIYSKSNKAVAKFIKQHSLTTSVAELLSAAASTL
jgi:hypothetical protein